MVLTLGIALFMAVGLLVRVLVVLVRQRHFLDKAATRAYDLGREKGRAAEQARGRNQLLRDLAAALDCGEMQFKLTANLCSKWLRAFGLLLPVSRDGGAPDIDETSVAHQLKESGFPEWQVAYLLKWRAHYPQYLVVLLIALMSGVSEEAAWGIACDV